MNIKKTSWGDCVGIFLDECPEGKKGKKLTRHTGRVIQIVSEIVCELKCCTNVILHEKMLYQSALFHDIAKFHFGKKRHHKKAKKMLSWYFSLNKGLNKRCSVIKAHKGKFAPFRKRALEAGILRMADKIDKINQGKRADFVDAYRKSMNKIEKFFRKEGLALFDAFQQSCEVVANRYISCYGI